MELNLKLLLKRMFYLIIIIIYMIFIIIMSNNNNIDLKKMGLMGWGLLILSIISWTDLKKELISPYILLLLMLYMFLFGQSLLIPFNKVQLDRDLLNLVNELSLYKAQVYTLICLGFFQLGAILSSTITVNKKYDLKKYDYESGIKIVGFILILISAIPFLIDIFDSLLIVKTYGYKGLYNVKKKVTGFDSIVKNLASYYIPAIICLFIAYKDNIKIRTYIFISSLISILLMLYTGERNNAVVFIFVIILLYHYCIKNITIKNSYKIILLSFILISLLNIIAETRKLTDRTLFTYIQYLFDEGISLDAITDLISELGWSMFPLTAIMDMVPDIEAYREGKTYLYSLLSIIPNLGFWDIHPAAEVSSLSPWLQEQLNMSYGPGFSIAAESYLNFGWYGSIVFLFLGVFYEKIFSLCNKSIVKYYPQLICYALIFFNASAFTVRDTFLGNVRALVYTSLPIYILINFINRNINKNN